MALKVYSIPADAPPVPEYDYLACDWKNEDAKIEAHKSKLAEYLRQIGYTGKHTGGIVNIPHADSHASYMIADAPRGTCLIHLPYMDAWNSPWASKLTKKEAIDMAERHKKAKKMFG